MSATWQGESSHEPHFGRRGRAWFRRQVLRWAEGWITESGGSPAQVERLPNKVAEWFTERCERYVEWKDEERYWGSRHADGSWAIQWQKVKADSVRVLRIATGLPDPALPPPPIPPGPIDVEAALATLGAPPPAPVSEPRASHLLTSREAHRRLYRAVDRMRRKRPRRCRVCDTEFIGRQVHVATCDSCKAAGRKRCPTCNEVFNTANPKAKRCPGCIEKYAALGVERVRAKERGDG
jgi:hypothetical protein